MVSLEALAITFSIQSAPAPPMTLQQLRDFIALAEAGSLRAAARSRGVTGPALAKSLRALEDELHVRLVERHARGTRLTEYGTALLAHAQLIVSQSQRAAEDIAQRRGKQEGMITVGVGPSPGATFIPEVVNEFQRRYPNVRIALVGGLYYDHVAPLRQGQMDMSILAAPVDKTEPGIQSEHLFDVDLVVACRHGHPLAATKRLADLQHATWALTGAVEDGPGTAILKAFKKQQLPPPARVVQCDLNWTLQNLLLNSDILCILPRLIVEQPAFKPLLRALPLLDPLPAHSICLLKRDDTPLLATADFFSTLVRRHAHYLRERRAAIAPAAGSPSRT